MLLIFLLCLKRIGCMAISNICFSVPTALLVLLASVVPAFGFYVGRVIHIHRRKANKLYACVGCVPARVTQVTLEAKTWHDGWVVNVLWVDEKTQQSYIFKSAPQQFRPKQQIGDNVLVLVESVNPVRYTIEL